MNDYFKYTMLIIWKFIHGVLLTFVMFVATCSIISLLDRCSCKEAKAAGKTEWRCKASPPNGTKFKDAIEIISFNEDRAEAEKGAIWLCNKMFKTDKCKIDNCKEIRR